MLQPALLTAVSFSFTAFFLLKALHAGSTGGSLFNFLLCAVSGAALGYSARALKTAYDRQQAAEADWSRTGSPFAPKAAETVTPTPAPVSDQPTFGRSSFDYDYGRDPAPNSTPSRSNPGARTQTVPAGVSHGYGERRYDPAPQQPYAPPAYAPAPVPMPQQQQRGMSPLAAGAAGLAVGGIAGYGLGAATAAHAAGGSHGAAGHGGETWAPRNRDDASLGAPLSGGGSQQSTIAPVTGDQLDAGQVGPGAAAAAAGAVGLGYGSGALDPILGDDLDAKTDTSATAPISGDSLWGSATSDATAPIESADIDPGSNPWSQTAAIDASELDGGYGGYDQTAAIDARDLEDGYRSSNYANDYGETAAVESSGFSGFGAAETVTSASIERAEPDSNDWGSASDSNDWGSASDNDAGGSDDWS